MMHSWLKVTALSVSSTYCTPCLDMLLHLIRNIDRVCKLLVLRFHACLNLLVYGLKFFILPLRRTLALPSRSNSDEKVLVIRRFSALQ